MDGETLGRSHGVAWVVTSMSRRRRRDNYMQLINLRIVEDGEIWDFEGSMEEGDLRTWFFLSFFYILTNN